jgi:hypothetical protein
VAFISLEVKMKMKDNFDAPFVVGQGSLSVIQEACEV